MLRRPGVLLLLLLLLPACRWWRQEPRRLEGLTFSADGRIVSQDLLDFKGRCEVSVGEALSKDLPGWRVAVVIDQDPYPAEDGVSGYWRELTATLQLTSTAADAQQPAKNLMMALARTRLKAWIRGSVAPVLDMTCNTGAGSAATEGSP